MKNSILFTTFLVCSTFGSMTYADEVELKRSCVKDNPLVAGETDATLLQIYAQACDKKNKDNKNGYLAQAAQQFQKIGRNYKALQLVNQLQANNVQHSTLTDVKFLAGIGIANEALTQIRGAEVRYLTDETYAPAIALNDAVKKAKPLTVIESKVEEAPKRAEVRSTRNTQRTATTQRRNTTSTRTRPTQTVRPVNPKPKPTTQPQRTNPFGSLSQK